RVVSCSSRSDPFVTLAVTREPILAAVQWAYTLELTRISNSDEFWRGSGSRVWFSTEHHETSVTPARGHCGPKAQIPRKNRSHRRLTLCLDFVDNCPGAARCTGATEINNRFNHAKTRPFPRRRHRTRTVFAQSDRTDRTRHTQRRDSRRQVCNPLSR